MLRHSWWKQPPFFDITFPSQIKGGHPYVNRIYQQHPQYSLDYFVGLGFKPEQLTLGLPFYCRIYDGTTSQGGGGYKWIINRFRGGINNWINRVDTGSQVFSCNSPDMIRDKTYFAMENQMAGVFCWCMGSDVGHDDPRSLSLTVGKTIERFSK